MTDTANAPAPPETQQAPAAPRVLPPAARRAVAEAEERRLQSADQARAAEVDGRGGLDPARYGDWEVNGRATDF
ncbi:MAG: DUF1674 domain-containing protein [Methylocystis sp.]|nr:DUF1674 domain-containing protein [Methylocystis sp.]MBI3276086.1 DUF1674 domain-containing protein [Methylocystis sp.]